MDHFGHFCNVAYFGVRFRKNSEHGIQAYRGNDPHVPLSRILPKFVFNPEIQKDIRFFRIFPWIKEKYYKSYYATLKKVKQLHAEEFKYTMPLSFVDLCKDYGLYLFYAWKAFTRAITIGQFTQLFATVGMLESSFTSVLNFFQMFNNQAKFVKAYLSLVLSSIFRKFGSDKMK